MNPKLKTGGPSPRNPGDRRCGHCDQPSFRPHPDGTPLCVRHYFRSRRRDWSHDVRPVLVKLTAEQVAQIPTLRAAGLTVQQIADMWGVSSSVIVARSRVGYHPKTEPKKKPGRRKSLDDKQ